MFLTYKYRLYPRNHERKSLDFILAQSRHIYNMALAQRRDVYEEIGKGVTYNEQWVYFRDLRREHPDTLGMVNATSLQNLLRRLDKAFKAFFRRVKAGEEPGYPRFKGSNRFKSLEYRHGDGCKLRVDKYGRHVLYVQNVGEIKVKFHRQLPEDAIIKRAVIKRNLGRWYVCLIIELPDPKPPEATGQQIGIDAGLLRLLTLSDETYFDNPRWLRKSLQKLRIKQRRLSRQKLGGNNWRKTAVKVAQLHEKVANQRRDFWHKTTRQLVNEFDLIAIEDLNLDFMTKNKRLSRSAHDAGLGLFRKLLEQKAEEAAVQIVAVPPQNTSQMCSGCGEIVPKSLSVRVHNCPYCHLIIDRDVNAARNILRLGRSLWAQTYPSGESVVQEAPHY